VPFQTTGHFFREHLTLSAADSFHQTVMLSDPVAEAGHAMKASVVCAGVLLLLFAGEAVGAGSGNSGDDIMPGCRGLVADSSGNLGDFRQGICAGSINAIIRFDPDICLAKGSTVGQAVRVVVQFIDSQPARLHEDFIDLAAEALRAAWPCPAQR
jgi:hypothetical protein